MMPLSATELNIFLHAIAEVQAPLGVTLGMITLAAPFSVSSRRRLQVCTLLAVTVLLSARLTEPTCQMQVP